MRIRRDQMNHWAQLTNKHLLCVGQTYLQAMLAQGNGIFDKTGADDAAAVTISNADEVGTAVNQFDSKVSNKVFGMFENGQVDFQMLLSNIQGKSNAIAGLAPGFTLLAFQKRA